MAQFAFSPGSGQPTLLWLDSVHTVRSTNNQCDDQSSVDHDILDPHSEFIQLTRELGEGSTSRSWTTFFPPKLAEIASGGGGSSGAAVSPGACLSAESQRSEFLRKRLGESSSQQTGVPRKGEPRGGSFSHCHERNFQWDARNGGQLLLLREEEEGKISGKGSCAPTAAPNKANCDILALGCGENGPDQADGENISPKDDQEEDDHARSNNNDQTGGHHQGHFALPTEAWAYRSTVGRGLYFSRTAGGKTGDRSAGDRPMMTTDQQWPRKRSTGTTMRRDGPWERMDLRSAAENQQRLRTSPLTMSQTMGTGSGERGATEGLLGVTTRHLTCTNGCALDPCSTIRVLPVSQIILDAYGGLFWFY